MKIVADENIPYAKETFGTLGEVMLLPGREIGPERVQEADLLIVRSVTPVGPALLEKSRVRFVGSATIGLDHVDQAYLQARGIVLAYAPGSNANSVAEYVVAAMLTLGSDRYVGKALGIIGLGRIGTLVRKKALALGMTVIANDPPLARSGLIGLVPLDELLARSDIVTCHVPLTHEGPDATYHLLDATKLRRLSPHAVVINTARGAVVDNDALLHALQAQRLGGAVLDVWEGEPAPDPELMQAVTVGTPHIAGYSFDGKVTGTRMLYEAACAFLGQRLTWRPPVLADERKTRHVVADEACSLPALLQRLVARAYDVRRDDAALRATIGLPGDERARAFDRLRAEYPRRLEFVHTTVVLPHGCATDVKRALLGIGFTVQESNER